MPEPLFNLSPDDAVSEMQKQLDKMRADKDRAQLKDISADDAYEIGYETALFDYRHFTGPNPMEIIPVEIEIPEELSRDA
jgi:hypothetical protein